MVVDDQCLADRGGVDCWEGRILRGILDSVCSRLWARIFPVDGRGGEKGRVMDGAKCLGIKGKSGGFTRGTDR